MSRRAAKVDANHGEIARYLLARGCSVQSMAQLGCGAPDLLVAKNQRTACVEVKDGEKPESERRLRPAQVKWRASWQGAYFLAQTTEDCQAVMKFLEG